MNNVFERYIVDRYALNTISILQRQTEEELRKCLGQLYPHLPRNPGYAHFVTDYEFRYLALHLKDRKIRI